MTPAQQRAIDKLTEQGFVVVFKSETIARVNRGADRRVVFADGSQKRGQHDDDGRPVNGHS